jgi:hypothetical protein
MVETIRIEQFGRTQSDYDGHNLHPTLAILLPGACLSPTRFAPVASLENVSTFAYGIWRRSHGVIAVSVSP